MKIFVMDRSYYDLKNYDQIFASIEGKNDVRFFTSANDLLHELDNSSPDLIIMDIDARNSLNVANTIMGNGNKRNVVFASNSSNMASEAMNMHCSGYLIKPIYKELIVDQMKHLLYR